MRKKDNIEFDDMMGNAVYPARSSLIGYFSPSIRDLGSGHKIADTSKWDGIINFDKMRAYGVAGNIGKASQGYGVDRVFVENAVNATKVNFPQGTYQFYDSRVPPLVQAQVWADAVKEAESKGAVFSLPHFGDYEENYGGNYGGFKNFKAMMQEFQRLMGLPIEKLGVYTSYYYWLDKGVTIDSWISQLWLWLAWYTTNIAIVKRPLTWGENKLILWQYTANEDAQSAGAESNSLDMSLAVSTEVDKMLEQTVAIADNMKMEVLVNLNGRTGPGLSFPKVTEQTFLNVGDIVQTDMRLGQWFRLSSVTRDGVTTHLQAVVWAFAGDTWGYMKEIVATEEMEVTFTDANGKQWRGKLYPVQ